MRKFRAYVNKFGKYEKAFQLAFLIFLFAFLNFIQEDESIIFIPKSV